MNFRVSLEIALATRNMKKKELAEKLGVYPSAITTWIKANQVTFDRLEAISKALDYKVSEFIALGEDK
jgi:DNA-binding Xre family transcriptional regulator